MFIPGYVAAIVDVPCRRSTLDISHQIATVCLILFNDVSCSYVSVSLVAYINLCIYSMFVKDFCWVL